MLLAGTSTTYELHDGEEAYLVPATGLVTVNGVVLPARDGAAVRYENRLQIEAFQDSEIVLVVSAGRYNQ